MNDIAVNLWRCRRGMREMDLIFRFFVEQHYDHLTETEKTAFQRLLDQADPDIMDWITQKTEPPSPDLKQLVNLIRRSTLHCIHHDH
jgi:Uncharacterized conserved protein